MGSCQVLAQSTSPTIRALECNVEGGTRGTDQEESELEGAAICVSIYLSLLPPRSAESAGEKQGHLRCSKSASAPAAWAPPRWACPNPKLEGGRPHKRRQHRLIIPIK